MHTYLDQSIQSLITRFPTLGELLSEAGIGCTTCSLGSCRVKDILEIHNLDTEASRRLLQGMGRVIYGDAPFEVPLIERQAGAPRSAFCPPIARMVEEHTYILRVIACLPALVGALREGREGASDLAAQSLDFIRTYADQYHHAKEEDILFGYFQDNTEILGVMMQDHRDGRSHVQAAARVLQGGDFEALGAHLDAYGQLLRGHIDREDHILYPWMDRSLSTRQVGELFARCQEVERRFQAPAKAQEAFVADLEARLAVG